MISSTIKTRHEFALRKKALVLVRIEDIFKSVVRISSEEKGVERVYPLTEITVQELFNLRLGKTPFFVLKYYGRYFYTKIPKESKVYLGKSLCAPQDKICKGFEQRCVKVIDRDVDSYRFLESNLSYEENTLLSKDEINLLAMKRSKRIEKYDFIVTGYETVNVTEEHFGVLKCNNCNLSISNDDVFKDFRP